MNYCTLFDCNYLSRGIALINSIATTHEHYSISILALDIETENYFRKNQIDNLNIVTEEELRSYYPTLTDLKKQRTKAEYCWTLTPFLIQYCLNKMHLDYCTYVDSDLYFFSSPSSVIDEIGDKSVIITEHNYTPRYDQTMTSGKYCVQFMYFKNDGKGAAVLEWWRQQCEKWCFRRCEDNKFGDQKYLDDWLSRFDCVFVPRNIGFGLGPWNIQQYSIFVKDTMIYARDIITGIVEPVVFYHFHNLRRLSECIWDLSNYELRDDHRVTIYTRYIAHLISIERNGVPTPRTSRTVLAEKNRVSRYMQKLFRLVKHDLHMLFLDIFGTRVYKEMVKDSKEKTKNYLIIDNNREVNTHGN